MNYSLGFWFLASPSRVEVNARRRSDTSEPRRSPFPLGRGVLVLSWDLHAVFCVVVFIRD